MTSVIVDGEHRAAFDYSCAIPGNGRRAGVAVECDDFDEDDDHVRAV